MDAKLSVGTITHGLGWSLLHQFLHSGKQGSTVLSPLSSSIAIAMAAEGLNQLRKAVLCEKLGVADTAHVQAAFTSLTHTLGANTIEGPLTLANAIFTDKAFALSPGFQAHIASFQAESQQFDKLSEATKPINLWIAECTRGMIKDMLSPDDLKNARVALVNALAFKGIWSQSFDPRYTQQRYDFQATPTQTSKVDMMFKYNNARVQTWDGDGFTAVRLPYKAISRESAMGLIAYLPKEGISMLEVLPRIRESREPQFRHQEYFKFGFPKLNIETHVDLLSLLDELGFPIRGQYPEMGHTATGDPLEMDLVLHRAVIKLDEAGTEAAAATVMVGAFGGSKPRPPINPILVFERPFVFSIVAEATGAVLFNGVFTGT